MRIESVQGPIDVESLGLTLMHEHIMFINWSMRQTFNRWIDRDAIVSRAVQSLLKAKELGLRTIIDATPINGGRDISIIREVADKSGIQIIAATGFYTVDEPFLLGWGPDRIADQLFPEVDEGIQGTTVKAGIIKCATETPQISDTNRKLLQAAARLHKTTGLPITTHTSSVKRNGPAQLKILLDEGQILEDWSSATAGTLPTWRILRAYSTRAVTLAWIGSGLTCCAPRRIRRIRLSLYVRKDTRNGSSSPTTCLTTTFRPRNCRKPSIRNTFKEGGILLSNREGSLCILAPYTSEGFWASKSSFEVTV